MCGRGVVTMAEVMLMMRPKRRCRIAGNTARISIRGAIMLASIAASQRSRSMSAKGPGEGPALLLTRMSGEGAGGEQPRLAVDGGDVGRHRGDVALGDAPQFGCGLVELGRARGR